MLTSEPRPAAGWIPDPGLQAWSPKAQIPHPSRGASPWPSLSTHSHLGPACPLPREALLTWLPLPDSEATAKVPQPPFCSPILQIRIPSQFRWGWRGGGCRGGGGPPQPEIGREASGCLEQKKGEPSSPFPGLWSLFGLGAPLEASFTQGHILQIGPLIPTPSRDVAVSAGL